MLEVDKNMVELLRKGVTFSKLKSRTDLCSSDLVKRIHSLEDKGYLIHKLFYDHGVKFKIMDEPVMPLHDNIEIGTNGNFSFLVISDTHLGNIYENIELIQKVYNYAEDNNIRYVFHLGDMTEGIALPNQGGINRVKRIGAFEQVDFVTRNYPKSENIETIYILGNHDYRFMSEGIDISRVIERRRLDMHFAGYKNSRIRVGNRSLLLHHPFTMEKDRKYDDEIKDLYFVPDFDIVLRGHTHHSGIYINDMDSLVINASACYSSPSRQYIGIYGITLKENEAVIDNLIVGNEVSLFSVIKQTLKPKVKKLDSQVDKFNARNAKKKGK